MSEPWIAQVRAEDRRAMAMVDALLAQEGIRRDPHLDYTCAMFDGDGRVLATGSCFGATLRCFAVDSAHRGEGLLNQILTHLVNHQAAQGRYHLFLYTKPEAAGFFGDLGFHEIARVPDALVFMENRRNGFPAYLRALAQTRRDGLSAAVVMNADPFTLGHQFLAEQAAAHCDTLHLFLVSEDLSAVPFADRKRLAELGTAHIPNVVLHDCGPYLISAATFPSYFLKEETELTQCQAALDTEVFRQIAGVLNITERWVGEEPDSAVTALYNRVMADALPKAGIRCVVLPRKEANGVPISAGAVRACLRRGDVQTLKTLVPQTTLDDLTGPAASRIRLPDNPKENETGT